MRLFVVRDNRHWENGGGGIKETELFLIGVEYTTCISSFCFPIKIHLSLSFSKDNLILSRASSLIQKITMSAQFRHRMSFSFYTNIAHTFDVRYLIFDSFVFFVLHIKLNSEMWSTLTAHWIRFVDDNHVFVMISTFQWRNFSRPLMRFRSLSPFFFVPVDTFGWFFALILFYVSIL